MSNLSLPLVNDFSFFPEKKKKRKKKMMYKYTHTLPLFPFLFIYYPNPGPTPLHFPPLPSTSSFPHPSPRRALAGLIKLVICINFFFSFSSFIFPHLGANRCLFLRLILVIFWLFMPVFSPLSHTLPSGGRAGDWWRRRRRGYQLLYRYIHRS